MRNWLASPLNAEPTEAWNPDMTWARDRVMPAVRSYPLDACCRCAVIGKPNSSTCVVLPPNGVCPKTYVYSYQSKNTSRLGSVGLFRSGPPHPALSGDTGMKTGEPREM